MRPVLRYRCGERARLHERRFSLWQSASRAQRAFPRDFVLRFAAITIRPLASAKELLAMKENPREAKDMENTRTAVAQGWFSLMGAMVQFRKWDDILSTGNFEKPAKPRLLAWYHWARAIAQAEKGNVRKPRRKSALMKTAIQAHKQANKGKVRAEMRSPKPS